MRNFRFTIYDFRFGKLFQGHFFVFLLTAYYLLLTTLSAQAQLKVEIDSNKRVVGDRITVKVTGTFNKNSQVYWSQPDLQSRKLELIDSIQFDTTKKGDDLVYKQTYQVSAYDSGKFYFPSLQFVVTDKGGQDKKVINTDSLPIYISLVKVDTTQPIKPIKEPVAVPFTFKEFWPLLAWIFGGLALIAGIIFLVRWLNNGGKIEKKIPLKPPYEEAMIALEQLQKKRLWESGDTKGYYISLADVLRKYITRVWNMDALEMTTSEIIRALKKETVDKSIRNELKDILELADLVKFAKHNSVPDENIRSMDHAMNFLRNTRPQETEPAENNAN